MNNVFYFTEYVFELLFSVVVGSKNSFTFRFFLFFFITIESLIACHPVGSIRPNLTTAAAVTRMDIIDDGSYNNGQFQREEILQNNNNHHHSIRQQYCQCKKLVTGNLCDKCLDGSFYLNDFSHTGCIKCFCFGITENCLGATNLYRNHISANIDRYSHGFILRDHDSMIQEQSSSSSSAATDSLTFDHLNREIIFQNFSQTSGHLYWQLPFNFLGNHIKSYGGYLNYTFRFQGNYFQHSHDDYRKPFAIIMGNNRTIEYYHQQSLHPLISTTINIALIENQWKLSDDNGGQQASRNDLMIILANIDSIQLLATVTDDISWIGLIAVTLDTSVEIQMLSPSTTTSTSDSLIPHSISISTQKVDTVELCHCPQGYSGTSCERCAPGYKMQLITTDQDSNDLDMNNQFHRCIPCFCNGHSIDCNSLTGYCMDCQHHTTGPYCDQCEPGYNGNATNGQSDDCQPTIIGSNHHHHHRYHHHQPQHHDGDDNGRPIIDDKNCQCNRNGTKNAECHPSSSSSSLSIMNCDCKQNVLGDNCDHCRDGYFNLADNNPYGCSSCYCFGVTDQCQSSRLRRTTIWMDFSQNYFIDSKLELATRFQTIRYTDRIAYNFSTNEAHFYSLFWLHENPPIDQPDSNPETLYWFLPNQFLGNRLSSYGGRLRFTRKYLIQNSGHFINDADVFIFGNGLILQYISSTEFPSNFDQRFEIGLQAEDELWQKIDHQTQATGMANRLDFLQVLVNVEMIAIRATFHTQMKQSFLSNIGLDIGVESFDNDTIDIRPFAIEVEQCNCPEGYQGLSCEQCSPNFIREIDIIDNNDNNHEDQQSTKQPKQKCIRCRCNQHSDHCDPNTGYCLNCQHNTGGNHCEQCLNGYYGDATFGTVDDCRRCPCPSESMSNNFSPLCKLDIDGLPTCTQCIKNYTGRNCEICNIGYQRNESIANSRCESIQSHTTTIRVQIDGPKVKHIAAGSQLILKCTGTSQISQYFNLDWIKLEGQLPPAYSEASGTLTIPNIQPEHSGTYVCSGFDLESVATARTIVIVRPSVQKFAPKIHIEPEYLEVHVGNPVTFKCLADGFPRPRLSWKPVQQDNKILNPTASFQPETGVFHIPSAKKSDEAEYECHATNSAGSDSRKTVLFVHDYHKYAYVHVNGVVPTARVQPSQFDSIRGERIRFDCNVTGRPIPSVRWIFVSGGRPTPDGLDAGQLPNNSRVMGNVLTITNIDYHNNGVYTCIASNSYGTAEAQVRLNVNGGGSGTGINGVVNGGSKHRSPPMVNIEPARQTIVQGQRGELRCITSGQPRPTISWLKLYDQIDPYGNRHEIDGDRLFIRRMEIEDRGIYVCRAENIDGVSNASAFVEIERRQIPSIEIDRVVLSEGSR